MGALPVARQRPVGWPLLIDDVAVERIGHGRALGANRFDLKYGMGGLSHEALMTNIELYGTQDIPRVRELLT
jgi:hypothetical protein